MRLLVCLLCAATAFAADAVVIGRVFDEYHRPVPSTTVAPMVQRTEHGEARIYTGAPAATVDAQGFYKLQLAPGRYVLGVLPPPGRMDFATEFPLYYPGVSEYQDAQAVTLQAGETRAPIDFTLIATEGRTISGRVEDIPNSWKGPAAVSLFAGHGYAGPLRTVRTDGQGRFRLELVPEGSYELRAAGPVIRIEGLDPVLGDDPRYGRVRVEVTRPHVAPVGIHLRTRRAPGVE